jgi:ABC-2 type transport system permease protein
MSAAFLVYRRWLRDRRLSTFVWTLGLIIIIVATAAFYPALASSTEALAGGGSEAMTSVLGLSAGINPGSPLGYLWVGLYANILPWTLMALGVSLGSAAIAGDEDTGSLEYLLSGPVTRTQVALGRFAAAFTVLLVASTLSALSLIVTMPLFELTDSVTTTLPDGTTSTAPGASAVGIGGYVLYTLSSMTSSLDALTWVSPWRWYVDDVMLINGLTWSVLLPFAEAAVCLLVGWWAFLRRDLRSS